MLLVFMAALVLASHASAQVAVDQVSYAQAADVAVVAKVYPFPQPNVPTNPTKSSAPVSVIQGAGHSSSLSWRELQQSMYCTRTYDFKTKKWKICEVTQEMRKNMIASWVKNRKRVNGNVPSWMTA